MAKLLVFIKKERLADTTMTQEVTVKSQLLFMNLGPNSLIPIVQMFSTTLISHQLKKLKAYPETSQRSKIECFSKLVNG